MQGKDLQPLCNSLPNMLALRLMLSFTYYAKNYPGIIGLGLCNAQQQKPLIAIMSYCDT